MNSYLLIKTKLPIGVIISQYLLSITASLMVLINILD
jgi:hypothetical protein